MSVARAAPKPAEVRRVSEVGGGGHLPSLKLPPSLDRGSAVALRAMADESAGGTDEGGGGRTQAKACGYARWARLTRLVPRSACGYSTCG